MKRLALPLVLLLSSVFGVLTASAQTTTESASSGQCGGSYNCQATFPDGSKVYFYFARPYGLQINYIGQTCGLYGCNPGPDYNFYEGSAFCNQPSCADPNISGGIGEIDFNRAVVSDDGQPTGQIAVGRLTFLYGKACLRCGYQATNIVLNYEIQ
jgi:hypothetical protein